MTCSATDEPDTPVPPSQPVWSPHPTVPQAVGHLGQVREARWLVHGDYLRASRQQGCEDPSTDGAGPMLVTLTPGTHLERHSSLRAWMAMRVMFTDIRQKGNCWKGGSKVSGQSALALCISSASGGWQERPLLLYTLRAKTLNCDLRPGI